MKTFSLTMYSSTPEVSPRVPRVIRFSFTFDDFVLKFCHENFDDFLNVFINRYTLSFIHIIVYSRFAIG